ncbi:hypothetical protein Pelo_18182 [Pelomyxa schiedti]|nr:hypothetical protein Pelo_18182 [Pelomyxa schiedti]
MKWFLNHSSMKGVDESVIVDCIEAWGNEPSSCTAILLMEHFHISEPKRSQLLVHILKQGVRHGTLSQIKKIIFMGEFSKESVAKCLVNSFGIESTKTAKWLINHFQLERQHITLDNNRMLLKLISGGKWSSAEWLINKFHITLDEIFHFKWEKDSFMWIDLFTWKMIQQVFPGLTGGMVKESFLPLVCQSPVIAQIAMKRFPQLTMDDILAICSSAPFYQFPLSTRLWLRKLRDTHTSLSCNIPLRVIIAIIFPKAPAAVLLFMTQTSTDSSELAPLQQRDRAASVSRAVSTSTIVWEWVLPWLLPESLVVVAPHPSDGTRVKLEHCVELCGIAEAMFPLVGRACSSMLAWLEHWGRAARCAAEAGSRLCVGWLLRNRRSQPPCGGADEDEETRRRGMRRRRGNKAFMRVLEGLCVGGHLGMAQSLVDPGGHGGDGCCSGWAAGIGLVWLDGGGECVVDNSLVDHVRASDLLKGVCEKGHVEVAKWVVERFMVRETWEFAEPLSAAVLGGHLELAQWLVNTFDLVPKFSGCSWIASPSDSCESENVEVVKWFLETFSASELFYTFYTLSCCLCGKSSKSVEVCKFINEGMSSLYDTPHLVYGIRNLDVMKWAISSFPSFEAPTKKNLERFCAGPEGVQFCQWLVEERSFTPTPLMFQSACKNTKDNTQTAKWLSTRVPLSPEVITDSFIISLASNNTSIASWLDETFHILNPPNSNSLDLFTISCSIFVKLCKRVVLDFQKVPRIGGMKWFLNHSSMKGVDESVIVDCIEVVLKESYQGAILLMEHFPISEPKRSQLLVCILKQGVQRGTLAQIKKIVSMGEFSKESVANCLLNSYGVESTKTAKWLINHFQLEHQHIALDLNMMLFNMISWGQGSCAEWIINKFGIALDEVQTSPPFSRNLTLCCQSLHLKWEKDSFVRIDLFTWKVIQQVFPGLTADMIKERFLPLVCQSPVIAQVAMKRFPQLTMDDILAFCSSAPRCQFPLSTHLWLRVHDPLIWKNS